jgi:hypothetical protein
MHTSASSLADGQPNTTLILRSGLLAASRRIGHKRPGAILRDAAKRPLLRMRAVDCFVAEFIIGPAKGRTRWLLAMTMTITP